MQVLLQQVGELLLGSLPTLILFIVLVLAYQILVQGPLSRTLKERRARTAGAQEEAQKAIAAAEAKAADYASRLRHARMEVFKVREARLKQWAHERDEQLAVARRSTGDRVTEAKAALQAEASEARKTLLAGSGQLAEQVVRAVMPATAGGTR
jgi:F-type H+-transporting ATPase subunit b